LKPERPLVMHACSFGIIWNLLDEIVKKLFDCFHLHFDQFASSLMVVFDLVDDNFNIISSNISNGIFRKHIFASLVHDVLSLGCILNVEF
jgi:hypothetical protein